MSKAPPVLHFDDGTRVMMENQFVNASETITSTPTLRNPRGQTLIETYYEIDRISSEIVQNILPWCSRSHEDGFLCKVALQFPDELLPDTSQVAWLMEDTIFNKHKVQQNREKVDNCDELMIPLIFVLGDTTYASCCPDEIGAQHLNADVIVHFGQHACLSISNSLPVIYSFGVEEWDEEGLCTAAILDQFEGDSVSVGNKNEAKIIFVCERRHHHHMNKIAKGLQNEGFKEVIVGKIPISQGLRRNIIGAHSRYQDNKLGYRNREMTTGHPCETSQENDQQVETTLKTLNIRESELVHKNSTELGCMIGGLHVCVPLSELSEYILIFIGDDSGHSESRQFLNTILKCTSPESQTKSIWSFNPSTCRLSRDPMSSIGVSKYLNRRFYLTQKAKMANIMGILVGTLSQDRFRTVVESVRQKIEASGRSCYTFVVGKINIAKLANFAEVECFILVACGETSILRDEREFHVPIITPSELEIALGGEDWGGSASCNTDFGDYLQNYRKESVEGSVICGDEYDYDGLKDHNIREEEDTIESDDDEPFFSMISGTYVSKPMSLKTQKKSQQSSTNVNVDTLPTQGQMTEYKSDAAEFWKKREYKGLEAHIGKTEAKAATEGQTGIASDYGK